MLKVPARNFPHWKLRLHSWRRGSCDSCSLQSFSMWCLTWEEFLQIIAWVFPWSWVLLVSIIFQNVLAVNGEGRNMSNLCALKQSQKQFYYALFVYFYLCYVKLSNYPFFVWTNSKSDPKGKLQFMPLLWIIKLSCIFVFVNLWRLKKKRGEEKWPWFKLGSCAYHLRRALASGQTFHSIVMRSPFTVGTWLPILRGVLWTGSESGSGSGTVDTGWSCLGLTCTVQWPLHIFFTPSILKKSVTVLSFFFLCVCVFYYNYCSCCCFG